MLSLDNFFVQLAADVTGKWPLVDFFIIFYAKYLGYALLGLLGVLFLRNYKRNLFAFLQMGLAALLSRGIITEAIRFLWHRERPFIAHHVVSLISQSSSGSFPSGHATFYFAIAAVVYVYNRKLGIFFFAGSALIGLARVFAGIHWFSDILAGALIGVFSGWIVVQYAKGLLQKFNIQ